MMNAILEHTERLDVDGGKTKRLIDEILLRPRRISRPLTVEDLEVGVRRRRLWFSTTSVEVCAAESAMRMQRRIAAPSV